VTTAVCDSFLSMLRLHPGVMQPAFGMAEVCTCMTYNNEYDQSKAFTVAKDSIMSNRLRLVDNTGVRAEAIEFVDLGDASPGVEMRITKDGGSHVLDELQVGHLQIRAPCVMLGYHDNSMANAECYPGDDWFDSGDLGFIHAGRLALTGRAKEMIIIRGANFYCYEVEARALEVAGTVAPLCAATSVYDPVEATEALLVFFVARADVLSKTDVDALHELGHVSDRLAELVGSIRRTVATSLGLTPHCTLPVLDANFHRTTSGKIQRGAFKREYEQGKYTIASEALLRTEASPVDYCLVWQPMPLGSAGEAACSENPMYVFVPETTSTNATSLISAWGSSQKDTHYTTLSRDVAEHGAQIAASELDDWAPFATLCPAPQTLVRGASHRVQASVSRVSRYAWRM